MKILILIIAFCKQIVQCIIGPRQGWCFVVSTPPSQQAEKNANGNYSHLGL
ncbi:hypothetical protein [Massilia sp. PWRC2]|uniref:hypothetical protein n=1 Tax=Massilia sp. PWRC2 TaxID=2804626 RepID=UPI003CEFDB2D